MLKLQSPIKPKSYGLDRGIIQLTQLFGENALDYSQLGIVGHNGIDYRTKHCQDGRAYVLAAHDGIMQTEKNYYSETGGKMIKLVGDNQDIFGNGHKGKPMTMYCHLSEIKKPIGAFVKKGQMIGIAGNTGSFTTGAHLHFGLYIMWEKLGFALESDNGYGGAFDPLPFLTDEQVCQYGDTMYGRKFFYNGKQISREQVDNLIPKQYRT